MPTVVVAAIAYAVGEISIWYLAATIALTAYQYDRQSAQRRKAKRDYNDSLQDRINNLALVDGGRSRIYGRVRVADGVIFKGTSGSKKEKYTIVVALAGHEIDAVEKIYFNDVELTLDGSGYVASSPWSGVSVDQAGIDIPAGQASVTLPAQRVAPSVRVIVVGSPGEPFGNYEIPFTQGGTNNLTVTPEASFIGLARRVVYSTSAAQSKARVRPFLGAPGQDLSTALSAAFPGLITSAHKFQGIACLLVELDYDQDAFATGVPAISAVVRGAKVYDPRTTTTAWTENPALIARDWSLYAHGGGALAAELDGASFIAAANACDIPTSFTTVTAAGAPITQTLPLYTCGIAARTDQRPDDVLAEIVAAMAGRWAWAGGLLRVRAGVYQAPVVTVTEDWITGAADIEIVPTVPRTELVNVLTPTISNAAQSYIAAPIPRIAPAAYIEADGGEYPREISLPAVTDVAHAAHICGVMLRDTRQALTVTLPCNLRALQLELFDVVSVDLPRFGWSNKPFEVLGWAFTQEGGITLSLKETDASIYQPDAEFLRADAAPNTALPNPFIVPDVAPSALESGNAQLLKQSDGTIVSRLRVAWPAVQDEAVRNGGSIEIKWGRLVDDPALWQTTVVPGEDTQALIVGVQDGAVYGVTIRAKNKLTGGKWSTLQSHAVQGKSAPPSDVAGLTAIGGAGSIAIKWTACPDLDYAVTELRSGTTWASATPIWRGTGNAYEATVLPGPYTILARHIDTTGNISAATASTTATVTAASGVSKTLTIRLNADTFSGPTNYNEAYIHGIDNGTPVDAPGQILVNGVATAAPNSPVFTNRGPVAGFVVWARDTGFSTTQGTRPYVMARKAAAGWEYDDNSSGWVAFTPDAQHVIVGTIETGSPDAGNPGSPPGITAASIWAAATTLDALGSLADAGFAAQTAASAAAASASSALSTLATMRSNGFLDAAEKPAVIREWQRISGERAGIVAQANVYGIVAERDAYTSAHDALNAYLSGLSPAYNDTTTDTPITPAVDQATWAALYVARQALLNRIADEAGKRAAWTGVAGRPKSYRVGAYGLSATNLAIGADLLDADTNANLLGGGPMYRVAKIHRTTKVLTDLGVYNPLSGALGALGECNAMAVALNSIDSAHICVVYTYDEPATNRLLGNLPAAMYRNGASQAVWGSPAFRFRSAYILVGIGGCGEGNGAECYAGAVDSDANARCEISFQITELGSLVVSGTTSAARSLVDFGYTGDLNATRGAPAGTTVGSIPAEAVESISGAQAKADAAAAAAQSAAQAYALAEANAANVSARAYADGIVTAEEARAIADAAAKAEAARVAAVSAAAADATAKADVAATTALWPGVSGVNVVTAQIAANAVTNNFSLQSAKSYPLSTTAPGVVFDKIVYTPTINETVDITCVFDGSSTANWQDVLAAFQVFACPNADYFPNYYGAGVDFASAGSKGPPIPVPTNRQSVSGSFSANLSAGVTYHIGLLGNGDRFTAPGGAVTVWSVTCHRLFITVVRRLR